MISKILDYIRANKFANWILSLLSRVGLDKACFVVLYKYYEKHPTETMRQSVQYFDSHKKDLKMIRNLLADEKSKQIWMRLIKIRKTMNYRVHPGYEMPQYFVKDIIKFGRHEVFVDGGGYDGMTSLEFIQRAKSSGGGYHRVVVFEPDESNFKILKKNMSGVADVHLFKKGLWNKKTSLSFCSDGTMGSRVIEADSGHTVKNQSIIHVVALDDIPECQDATFIKMDLEGSEMMALEGAKNIIQRNKPKLAICLYHSDQDMIEIIKYVHQLVPEYKLYVRHHSKSYTETVLYAVF